MEKEAQIAGSLSSINDTESDIYIDDGCNSENSFGSDFGDHATVEENFTTNADLEEIEPESPPPNYPDEEYPQSMSILTDMDQKSPPVVLQVTLPRLTETALNKLNANHTGLSMCVVCNLSPAYSKGRVSYPTCGLTCASKLEMDKVLVASSNNFSQSRGSARASQMCEVCHVRPRARKAGKNYRTCGFTCDASLTNSRVSSKGNASALDPELVAFCENLSLLDHSPRAHNSPWQPSRAHIHNAHDQRSRHGYSNSQSLGVTRTQIAQTDRLQPSQLCVVCRMEPCRDDRYVTCGIKCAERLCKRGSSNPKMCDYCHRRPKVPGYNQCGDTCRNNASKACLLCRCRPKFGRYPLCGRTCKKIATGWTPLILEARPGHAIYAEVEQRFKGAWKGSGVAPPIKNIYKIIEKKFFLLPYDKYKRRVGNEVFRYHGTSRNCTLGSKGNTRLCSSNACALCSILRTSFKVSLASPNGAFGAGIYTSSAANKAYSFSMGGSGALILTKVVLGNVYKVTNWNQVMSCPSGHDSVIFNRQNGTLNETIVYNDDAIRPVYLIIF